MKTGTFMDIVSVHYDEFKKSFVSRDSNKGRRFDEDSFNDAFIKCANKFGNDIIAYDDAIKYFWVTYSNTVKSIKQNTDVELDDALHDVIDDDEPSKANYIYNIVMAAITEAFNEDDMMVYSLYKYHNWAEDELIAAGYDCKNLDIRIKTIHKFVKSYCKKRF